MHVLVLVFRLHHGLCEKANDTRSVQEINVVKTERKVSAAEEQRYGGDAPF